MNEKTTNWQDFTPVDTDGKELPQARPTPAATTNWDEFTPVEEPKPRGLKGWAQDAAAWGVKGAIAVPEAAVGLADIATGGRVGKFLENEGGAVGFRPKQAKEAVNEWHSDATKEAQRKFEEAEGLGGKFMAAVQNPSNVLGAVVESLPSMGAGGVAARGLMAATRLGQMGAKGAAVAGALGEGITGAGSAAEQIRQETDDGLLTPGQAGLAGATGVVNSVFGVAGGRLSNRLGIGDADTMLAQGTKGMAEAAANPLAQQAVKSIPRQVVEGAIAEGLLEELPQSVAEQVFQNIALDKEDWLEDVDSAAVMGVLSGGAMGAGAAGFHGIKQPRAGAGGLPVPGEAIQAGVNPDSSPAQPADLAPPSPGLERMRREFDARMAELQQQEQGEPEVPQTAPPDGAAVLAQQQAQHQAERAAQIEADRAVESPDDEILQSTGANQRPSEAMGLRSGPEAGALEDVAALAVDTGLSGGMQQAAALQQAAEAAEAAAKEKPAAKKAADPKPLHGVDGETGEFMGDPAFSAWSDAQLSETFRSAQSREVRLKLAKELSRRRTERLLKQREADQTTQEALNEQAPEAHQTSPEQPQAGGQTPAGGAAAPAPAAEQPGGGVLQASGLTQATAAEPAEQRAQRVADAGAAWTRTLAAERQAAVARLQGVKPVIAKNLPRAQWENLNGDIQRKLADALAPAQQDVATPAPNAQPEARQFAQETGTLGIPRADMPQVATQSHGGLVKHLNAQGIAHETTTVDASALKPTQAEYIPEKVAAAKTAGGDRSVIVSSDGHIIDGHHQALAAAEEGKPVKAIVLDAPVEQALAAVKASPSVQQVSEAAQTEPTKPEDSTPTQARREPKAKTRAQAERWLELTSTEREQLTQAAGLQGIFATRMAERRWANLPDAVREKIAAQLAPAPDTPVAGQPAPAEFPLSEAESSYAGISHRGTSRAKADGEEFQAYIDQAQAAGAAVAQSDAQKAAVAQAVDALRADYLVQYRRLMSVRAGTYSGFVAGRSGLNSKQADKRNSAYDRAIDTFVAWQKANQDRLRQTALDARTDEEKAADRQAAEQARAEKAQRKDAADRRLMGKILSWKKGGEPVAIAKSANLAGVNYGKDGYPTSIKLTPTDGSVLTDDKFDLAALFRGKGTSVPDSKRRVRELVDAVRAGDEPSVLRTADGDEGAEGGVVGVAQADQIARGILAKAGLPQEAISTVESFAALPQDIQAEAKAQGAEGQVKGVFHRSGVIYLVADQHTSAADVRETVLHELMGHKGVRTLFGADYVAAMNRLFTAVGGWEGVKRIAGGRGMLAQVDGYRQMLFGEGRPDWSSDMRMAILTDELMAAIAQKPKLLDRAKEVIGAIRQWLRKSGFAELATYGETDLLRVLQQGRQAMQDRATAPGKTVFLFAGEGARTAAQGSLVQARERVTNGEDAEDVRQETGWHRGVDGQWRFEIDDSQAQLLTQTDSPDLFADVWDEASSREEGMPLGRVLDHPKLFAAYPQLKSVRVKVDPSMKGEGRFIDGDRPMIVVKDPFDYQGGMDALKSVLLHELQHAIQRREGFATGGSPSMFTDADGSSSFDQYERLAGEVEARNTQARLGLSEAERRATAPAETGDVAEQDQLVRRVNGVQASLPGTKLDRAVLDMVAEKTGAQDVLKLIASSSKRPFYRQLARLLTRTGVKPSLEMHAMLGGKASNLGRYRRSDNSLALTPAAEHMAEQVFLHEMVHAATLAALDRKGLASVQMRRLFHHVQRHGGAKGWYGMTNVGEFVAEAFSNPDFQRLLRSIPAPPGGNAIQNAWDGFLRILKSILGLPRDASDALSRVMDLGVPLMREDMGVRQRLAARAGPDAFMGDERSIAPVSLNLQGWSGNRGELRKLAGAWHSENLQGKAFRNDDMGVDVAFTSEGKGTAFATSGNLRVGWRAEMVKAMPELIRRAVKVQERAPDERRTRDTRMFHTLVAPLMVNGEVVAAKITLREALTGPDPRHKFYDVTGLEIEDGSVLSGLKGVDQNQNPLPTGTEPSRISVAELARASKIDGYESDDDAFFDAATLRGVSASALDQIHQSLSHPGKVSLWDKTVGTMRGLAERSPAFKPVFESAQRFIDDVSMLANDAANVAPRLLPRVEDMGDILGKNRKTPISAADNKAVARPLFEGTLSWTRDEHGKPVLVDALKSRFASFDVHQKADLLRSAGHIDPDMLKAWQGKPIEQFEGLINSRFDSKVLKPGIVWKAAELKAMFGLTDEQVSLYREARQGIDRSIDMTARTDMLRALGDDFADMRDMVLEQDTLEDAHVMVTDLLQQELHAKPDSVQRLAALNNAIVTRYEKAKELMDAGYAPLSRFGRYTVDVVSPDGQREYFGMFESIREANQMALRMKTEFKGATITQGTMSQDAFKLFAGITPESLEMFGDMLGLDAKSDDAQGQAFQAYLQLAKNNHSALKRLIHRKGIAGYSEDVGRVLASFIYSNARLGAQGLNAGGMEKAINNIPKEQGELKDLAQGLRSYIQDPQEEGNAVRGMLFAQYLGGSVASALVNMAQPFQVTTPWLAQYGGMAKAGARMTRALKDMATKGFQYEPELAKALKAAEDDGVVSPQEIHQLMSQARGAGGLRSGDGTRAGNARAAAANAWERTKVAWGQPFALAEQFNRRLTFVAAYRTAREQGIDNPGGFARRAVLETQFLYSKANKPQWARGVIGGTLFTFKTYSVSYLELMHRMWTQGGPEGKRAVAWSIAMLMLMGGAGGLPFMEDAEDLIDGAGQMMGYNLSVKQARKEFLREWVGREFAEFIESGVSGLPGAPIDISGRLGMGNLLPGTGLFLDKPSRERDLLEVVGPAGDLISRGFSGTRKLLTGDVVGAALEVSPTAVRNAVKGADMAATGIYKDTKGYKVIDTTLAEAASKFIGFQPKSVAEVQEMNSFMQRSKSFYTKTSSEIKADWADAIFRKDDKALEKVRERLSAWNRNNPDQPITIRVPDVMKRAREMGKDRTDRIADTAPKALRGQLREMAQEESR